LIPVIFRIAAFLAGLFIVASTLLSAVKTFVLPRSAPASLTRLVFMTVHALFHFRLRWAHSYKEKDGVLAFLAPFSLLALLPAWYTLVLTGYMLMYWGAGEKSLFTAFQISGSSLFTLGFSTPDGVFSHILVFSESILGLILVALLIAYLPTMYSAFSRRETAVTLLEVRAGDPPSAIEMLKRFQRIHGLDQLTEQWRAWETWFADIEESHTSLAALVFFRSPQPNHSWVTAAGAVLDAASLTLSSVDVQNDPNAALCIRAGYLALRRIADNFQILYKANVSWQDPISVSREEFDSALGELEQVGVPLKSDREQAWQDFVGWRANYDTVLVSLAALVHAPVAPWSSDRTITNQTAVNPLEEIRR
jgi:hypothetical protein